MTRGRVEQLQFSEFVDKVHDRPAARVQELRLLDRLEYLPLNRSPRESVLEEHGDHREPRRVEEVTEREVVQRVTSPEVPRLQTLPVRDKRRGAGFHRTGCCPGRRECPDSGSPDSFLPGLPSLPWPFTPLPLSSSFFYYRV